MTQDERREVSRVLAQTAFYYGRQMSPEILSMMVDDLSELSVQQALAALQEYRRDPRNRTFPLPAQILSIVRPEVDEDSLAREAASRIQAAIIRFGYPNLDEAKEFIGDLGWRVVERHGGWTRLCEQHGVSIDAGTFMAQARDLVKSQLRLHKAGVLDQPPSLQQSRKFEQFAGSLVKTIDQAIKPRT